METGYNFFIPPPSSSILVVFVNLTSVPAGIKPFNPASLFTLLSWASPPPQIFLLLFPHIRSISNCLLEGLHGSLRAVIRDACWVNIIVSPLTESALCTHWALWQQIFSAWILAAYLTVTWNWQNACCKCTQWVSAGAACTFGTSTTLYRQMTKHKWTKQFVLSAASLPEGRPAFTFILCETQIQHFFFLLLLALYIKMKKRCRKLWDLRKRIEFCNMKVTFRRVNSGKYLISKVR